MTQDALTVLQEAMSLPDSERASVAAALLASLPAPGGAPDPDSETWRQTITRRAAESVDGHVGLEDWDIAEARILRNLGEA